MGRMGRIRRRAHWAESESERKRKRERERRWRRGERERAREGEREREPERRAPTSARGSNKHATTHPIQRLSDEDQTASD